MKVLDDQGKLFGKVNIIDFLVILFLVCIIPMFILGYRLFTNKYKNELALKKEDIAIELPCKFIKITPETLKLIAIGDKEIDNGKAIGEIVWIGQDRPYRHTFDIKSEQLFFKEDEKLRELPVQLRLKVTIKNDKLYYNTTQIMINAPIDFKTTNYIVTAVPIDERIIPIEKKYKKMELSFYLSLKGLDENTTKIIAVGDKDLDKQGEVIAEIISVGKIEGDTYDIDLGNRNFIQGEDSTKKQIVVKIRMRVNIGDDGGMYFKGRRIISDSWLEFKTDKYTALGKVARIYEAQDVSLPEKRLQIQVKFSGIIPEVTNIVAENDIEKDPTGKVMGRLKKIISKKPSDVLVIKEQNFITLTHPFQKDIVAVLDVVSIEKEGAFYFKNYPVKMGNGITFTTSLYSISGVVLGMTNE